MSESRLLFVSNVAPVDAPERVEVDVPTNDMGPLRHIYPNGGLVAYCGAKLPPWASGRVAERYYPEARACAECKRLRIERHGW